jgi:hypothetical protein
VTEPARVPSSPVAVPTLADLLADPSVFDGLPRTLQDVLFEQAVVLEARLRAKVMARHRTDERAPTEMGEVLGIEEAAKRLGTSVDSLYRKRLRLRLGYRDPLDGRLKFTDKEINDYIRQQHRRV